jgi:outer membrane receptor protein involved in Fe transport
MRFSFNRLSVLGPVICIALGLFLGFSFFRGTLLFAQEESAGIPTIYVTGEGTSFENPPFSEEQKARTANTVVYDQAEITNSSADNLADFLSEKGVGLMRSPTDYGHSILSFRGFRSDHLSKEMDGRMLFLVNGHRVGTSNPTQVSLLNVERIEIVRGAEMYKYAGTTAAGIVNVITRKGGPRPIRGSLELGIGSDENFKGTFKANGLYGPLDYSLGYSYAYKGDYHEAKGATVYHTETDGTHSVSADLGYRLGENHRLGVSSYYYRVVRARRPSYVDEEGTPYGPSYTNRLNSSNTISYEGGNGEELSWDLYYTSGDNWSKQYSNGERNLPMAYRNIRNDVQGSATYRGSYWKITGGFEFLRYDTEVGNPGGRPLLPTGKLTNLGLFIIGDARFLEDTLVFKAGLRYDKYKVSDKRIDPGDDPANLFGGNIPGGKSFDNLSPSVGLSYLPLDYLKLRVDFTRTFRVPSPRELVSATQEGYNFYGYPLNEGETSDSYEAGFDLNFRHISVISSFFFSHTKNYIYQHNWPTPATLPPGTSDRQRVRNSEKQYRSGIELFLNANVAGLMGYEGFELRPYFNYTRLFKHDEQFRKGYPDISNVSQNLMGSMGSWTPIVGVPDVTIAYGVRFRHPGARLSANFNVNHVGDFYAFSGYPNKTKAYDVADLTLSKELIRLGEDSDLTLKVAVNNLFNEYYKMMITDGYYMPGRTFYVGMEYNY